MRADHIGAISTGRAADLLVVEGDPLADIAAVRSVLRDGGSWLTTAERPSYEAAATMRGIYESPFGAECGIDTDICVLKTAVDAFECDLTPWTRPPSTGWQNTPVLETQDVVVYARRLADALRKDMYWHQDKGYGGYWKAINSSQIFQLTARACSALELLRQYAGGDSFWTLRAATLYDSHGLNKSVESGIYAIGDLLTAWVEQVEAGVIDLMGAHARDEVAVVSTDLMGQVGQLLERKDTHPAAAIVLCGAALESALRSVAEAKEVSLGEGERSSLATLTIALRKAELISKQDVKELQQLAGLRNAAAHGEFDDLSRERAGLMEQQVNIWLRRLADLFGTVPRPGPEGTVAVP